MACAGRSDRSDAARQGSASIGWQTRFARRSCRRTCSAPVRRLTCRDLPGRLTAREIEAVDAARLQRDGGTRRRQGGERGRRRSRRRAASQRCCSRTPGTPVVSAMAAVAEPGASRRRDRARVGRIERNFRLDSAETELALQTAVDARSASRCCRADCNCPMPRPSAVQTMCVGLPSESMEFEQTWPPTSTSPL